jgi:PPOX class probable F420-dependent enzyme
MTAMTPALTQALQGARRLYLTTYNRRGQSGTVPVWFFLDEGAIYFCTRRETLKVRRIRQTGRATVHLGSRTGPRLECTARLIEGNAALQERLLRTYRRRYGLRMLVLGWRLRRAFVRGDEIIVRLTPQASGG